MAITVNNAQTANEAGTSEVGPLNYTIPAGSNQKLVVCVQVTDNASTAHPDVTSVTYDGNNLTLAVDEIHTNLPCVNSEIWYIDDPAGLAASGDINVNFAGFVNAGSFTVFTLNNVASGAAEATASGEHTSDPIANNITTLTNNAIIISSLGRHSNNDFSPQSGQTEHSDFGDTNIRMATGSLIKATAGAQTIQWDSSGGDEETTHVLAAWAPGGVFTETVSAIATGTAIVTINVTAIIVTAVVVGVAKNVRQLVGGPISQSLSAIATGFAVAQKGFSQAAAAIAVCQPVLDGVTLVLGEIIALGTSAFRHSPALINLPAVVTSVARRSVLVIKSFDVLGVAVGQSAVEEVKFVAALTVSAIANGAAAVVRTTSKTLSSIAVGAVNVIAAGTAIVQAASAMVSGVASAATQTTHPRALAAVVTGTGAVARFISRTFRVVARLASTDSFIVVRPRWGGGSGLGKGGRGNNWTPRGKGWGRRR